MVDEALPARGPLQEVVDAALHVGPGEQGSACAVDGHAGVHADAGDVGSHQHRLVLWVRGRGLSVASRHFVWGHGVVLGIGCVLGHLHSRLFLVAAPSGGQCLGQAPTPPFRRE